MNRKELATVFQVGAVFIGTIVGAGLASGKEITEFFTSYGLVSFIGIMVCGLFYICIGTIISKISIAYKLNSYSDVMNIISPNIFGKLTGIITTLYLISSASIILAGSGALINQFFGLPKIIGSLIMLVLAFFFLLRETEGLVEINSFIVPTLIVTVIIISALYILFAPDMLSVQSITKFEPVKSGIVLSTILYAGYNTLCCSGVLVPLSNEVKDPKLVKRGIFLGVIGLSALCLVINLLLTINQPYIFKYDIPLLFVAQRFGTIVQALLLCIIWLEMFSTEVSDVYSICKTLKQSFNIKFRTGVIIVLGICLPISQLGFTSLITTLYPFFGLLSLIFISQCLYFYFKHKHELP